MAAYAPEQLFSAFEAHLEGSGLRLARITCRVSNRTERREWEGTSLDDAVRAAVSVSLTFRSSEFSLEILGRPGSTATPDERSRETNSVGLRNCLTVVLPPEAYAPRFSAARTGDELCAVVRGVLREAAATAPTSTEERACALTLGGGSPADVKLLVEDLRTSSLAQLLDGAPPRTEPSAAFFSTSTTSSCSVTMMTLPEGALRVNATNATVCTDVAKAFVAKH